VRRFDQEKKIILLDRQASVIHDRRLEAIPILSQKMVVILDTGMPNVRFDIQKTIRNVLQNW
jgi:DNA repair protein RecN (Recombination protein N)